jgi:hypothetical protein
VEARAPIDVLVAYTPAVAGRVGSIAGLIELAVLETNQSYANSGVRVDLRLVDSLEFPVSESGQSHDSLLTAFSSAQSIRSRRDAVGADVAVLIIDQAEYCGLAQAIDADAENAFAVVYYDCATGYYSFGHEIGHLQGARHDPGADPSGVAYAHGFQHLNPAPKWRTIMAYGCPGGCPRLPYWSSPSTLYNGSPMGTALSNDNTRRLNETSANVAGFRTKP